MREHLESTSQAGGRLLLTVGSWVCAWASPLVFRSLCLKQSSSLRTLWRFLLLFFCFLEFFFLPTNCCFLKMVFKDTVTKMILFLKEMFLKCRAERSCERKLPLEKYLRRNLFLRSVQRTVSLCAWGGGSIYIYTGTRWLTVCFIWAGDDSGGWEPTEIKVRGLLREWALCRSLSPARWEDTPRLKALTLPGAILVRSNPERWDGVTLGTEGSHA